MSCTLYDQPEITKKLAKKNYIIVVGHVLSTWPPLPERWEHAQGLRPWKLKRPFFICYQGTYHGIALIGFGWEIIED